MKTDLSEIFDGSGDVTDAQILDAILTLLDEPEVEVILMEFGDFPDAKEALQDRLTALRKFEGGGIAGEIVAENYQSGLRINYVYKVLKEHLQAAGMKLSDLKNHEWLDMDPSNYSHISRNTESRFKRDNAIKIAFILKMNFFDAYYWLSLNGHSLSRDNDRDRLLLDCLRQGEFDPEKINEYLLQAGHAILFTIKERKVKKQK